MVEKVDIVIQGPYTDYTDFIAESYLDLPFANKIIISCWKGDKKSKKKRGIKFVRNEYPFSPGTDNKNLQIVSSLNGLKKCKSTFAVKTRSDQKFTYDSMMKMYDFFMENHEKSISYYHNHKKPCGKILVAGFYPSLLFAIRDHIFWGYTEDLIDLFDIPIEQNSLIDKMRIPKEKLGNYTEYFTRTETYIAAHYCYNFIEDINRLLILPEQHLYDNSIYWYHSKGISDYITPLVFKSFPKTAIDLEWIRWRRSGFNFNFEEYINNYSWHEEGY